MVENLDSTREALLRRGPQHAESLSAVADKAQVRRDVIARLEALRAKKNDANTEMARLDKKGPEFAAKRDEMKAIATESKALEEQQREVEAALSTLLLDIPNLPADSTPSGKDEHDNVVVRVWGEKPTLNFPPRDHYDLGTSLGIVDFDRGAKIAGSRFSVLCGLGARMERALMSFMLDLHTDVHGYKEMWPPAIVNATSMRGTGQLPKFADDAFKLASALPDTGTGSDVGAGLKPAQQQDAVREDLYLVPTAEVPLTNLHANEILEPEQMPVHYTAYTPCFRSEAGSYGKDTRGLIRQHQFDKVELVRFERPENAEAALETLTSHAEEVLKRLDLHYRVVALCAGDMGFGSKKTYDLEVWLPGQDAYREISSCSWFGDFQARRAKIRYRAEKGGKPELVHTLNGSGLALGRTLVAILEQYQQADGSVRVPEALVRYVGTDVIRAGG